MRELPEDTWLEDPDWIGCANGCSCAPVRGRDICIVCVVASEGRCKREPEVTWGQLWLPLKECG